MSVNLRVLRRALARALGAPPWFVASTGDTSSLVCAAPFKSTELPTSELAYAWIFCPDGAAPRQRRVKANGLDPTVGRITVDDVFGAAVTTGTVFEVHPKLPAISEQMATSGEANIPSLHDALNDALKHIKVEDDSQTITLVNSQRSYSTAAIVGLDRKERLIDVRVLDAVSGAYVSTWHDYEFRESAAGNTLFFPKPFRFSGGPYTAQIVTWRPANTVVNGVTNLYGMAAEADTVAPEEKDILPGALAFCYHTLVTRAVGPARANYERLELFWRGEERKVRNFDASMDITTVAPAEAVA